MTHPRRVRDVVREMGEMVPFIRNMLTPEEYALGVHLRGNSGLYDTLTSVVRARLQRRAKVSEPSDPVQCKSIVARDRELQWLLDRLELVYRSPVADPTRYDGEPPA